MPEGVAAHQLGGGPSRSKIKVPARAVKGRFVCIAVRDWLRARLDAELSVRVADRVVLAVDRGDGDGKLLRVNLGKLWNVLRVVARLVRLDDLVDLFHDFGLCRRVGGGLCA